MSDSFPDRLPLVIGVTGHRDLRDQDIRKLEEEVAGIIATLRRDHLGDDAETPIIILSSLAEGADRLVARVALAQGAHLVAPLPLPVEEYRRDFEPGLKPGNIAEFDELLGKALAAPVMPFVPGNSLEAVQADKAKRAEQYRAVGLFIVEHCNVLMALWNGDDGSMSAGGTAEVVSFKRQGIPLAVSGSARASIDVTAVGPVVHVVTPRAKTADASAAVSVVPWGRALIKRHRGGRIRRTAHRIAEYLAGLCGRERRSQLEHLTREQREELEAWEDFEALVKLTSHFNREAAALVASSDGATLMDKSVHYLFDATDEPPSVAPAEARQYGTDRAPRWCRLYSIADALAQKRRKQFRLDWRRVYVLAFTALCLFGLFPLPNLTPFFEWAANPILVLYSLTFAALFAVFVHSHLGEHQVHFLDYRALAEALRVVIYWKLAGIAARHSDDRPTLAIGTLGAVADVYPMNQAGELAWAKIALRMLELVEAGEPATAGLDPEAHAIVRYYWVHGQFDFYGKAQQRHMRFAEMLERGAILFLVVSPFVVVPLVIAFTHAPSGGHPSFVREFLLLVCGLLPGLATVLNGYSEKLALKAQARQYDRMHALFGRAFALLPDTATPQTAALAQATYVELGRESLAEHAEWVAIYRQRPIEPPK